MHGQPTVSTFAERSLGLSLMVLMVSLEGAPTLTPLPLALTPDFTVASLSRVRRRRRVSGVSFGFSALGLCALASLFLLRKPNRVRDDEAMTDWSASGTGATSSSSAKISSAEVFAGAAVLGVLVPDGRGGTEAEGVGVGRLMCSGLDPFGDAIRLLDVRVDAPTL